MQKWEYTRLVCAGESVISVDGERLPGKQMALWREERAYPLLGDYIGRMGQEGWELVGMAAHTPAAGPGDCLMIFKRPAANRMLELISSQHMR